MAELIEYKLHPEVEAFTAGRDCALPRVVVQSHQVHDVTVARVDRPDVSREELEGYDALVTNVPGVCIGVRTADCIPILIYDPVKKAVAAVHSGWRGTVMKICEKALVRMSIEYGTKASDVVAIIGPGICADCFQVGEEVAVEFRKAGFDMDRIWSFRGPRTEGSIAGGHHIDLVEACRLTLIQCGVAAKNITVRSLCTYEHTELLYSARKEGSACGRNINAICIL